MPNLCLNDRRSSRFKYMTIAHPYNSGREAKSQQGGEIARVSAGFQLRQGCGNPGEEVLPGARCFRPRGPGQERRGVPSVFPGKTTPPGGRQKFRPQTRATDAPGDRWALGLIDGLSFNLQRRKFLDRFFSPGLELDSAGRPPKANP